MVIAADLRPGMVVRIEGELYKVLEAEFKAGAAKLSSLVKTKLRNVVSGRMWEPHFRPEERLDEVELEQKHMEFLFADGENCIFMDPVNFEQYEVARGSLGAAVDFLEAGSMVPVQMYEGHVISVVLPEILDARVRETAPRAHSQQDSTLKDATLENGLHIRVPLFIGPGDMVRVEVKSGRYVERARAERKRA